MLSRVAENVYWMARHLERAENTARLVSVRSETRLDRPGHGGFYWEPALRATGAFGAFEARGLARSEREATNFLISDSDNPSSVVGCVARARENIRILREALPRESWEAVQALHQAALRPGAAAPQQRDEHLRDVIWRVQGMAGLFLGAMNDDAGAAILRLGRAIERGDFGVRVLLEALRSIGDGGQDDLRAPDWVAVLRSLTAYQMYRRSVRGAVTRTRVLRFMTGSPIFPRSLAYCATEAGRALSRLPASTSRATRLAEALSTAGADASSLLAAEDEFASLHEAVTAAYFAPPAPQSQGQSQQAGMP